MPDKPEWDDVNWRLEQPGLCFDCHASLDGADPDCVTPAPMLKDEVWRAIGCGRYTLLCAQCVKQRIRKRLQRLPNYDDLTDVPFNRRCLATDDFRTPP